MEIKKLYDGRKKLINKEYKSTIENIEFHVLKKTEEKKEDQSAP